MAQEIKLYIVKKLNRKSDKNMNKTKVVLNKEIDGYKVIAIYKDHIRRRPEKILTKYLRQLTDASFIEAQAEEEEGYGLPENSIYLNYDARSFCGRWMEGASNSLSELFYHLLTFPNPETEYKIVNEISKFNTPAHIIAILDTKRI